MLSCNLTSSSYQMHAVWIASLEGKIKAEQVLRYSCVSFVKNVPNTKN